MDTYSRATPHITIAVGNARVSPVYLVANNSCTVDGPVQMFWASSWARLSDIYVIMFVRLMNMRKVFQD